MASPTADWGSGSTTNSTAVTVRPAHSGSPAPRRSTTRPIHGARRVLTSDASRNVAPIATPEAPKRERRRGSSVPIAPSAQASSRISQNPSRMRGLRVRARNGVRVPGSGRGGSGYSSVQTASASETTPTSPNTSSVPSATASVPSTGPSRVPKIAAPITEPRTSPRRSREVTAITQVRPPPQMQPQAAPCTKRSTSSVTMSVPKPNAAIAAANISRPTRVVRRTPVRVAIQPPSSAPGTMPAG
jgi:hypothetical protein